MSRAERLIRAALGEHITDYGNGGVGFMAFLKGRRAAWVSPRGKVHPLNTPSEHHHDWARDNPAIHKLDTTDYGSGQSTRRLTDAGWVRKMDHDQYVIGAERHKEKVFRHVAKHHPRLDRVWISHQKPSGENAAHWYHRRADGSWST